MKPIKPQSAKSLIPILIEDFGHNPNHLLESLIHAMSSKEIVEHLEYISDVEDWRFRVNEKGEIYEHT